MAHHTPDRPSSQLEPCVGKCGCKTTTGLCAFCAEFLIDGKGIADEAIVQWLETEEPSSEIAEALGL